MPRPKPPRPLVQFGAKLPPQEADALNEIVHRWAADVTAKLAAQGIHTPPPAERTAWLRAKIREDAARYGIEIVEPTAAPPPPPPAKPAKRAKKT